jgi:hypothetical protein
MARRFITISDLMLTKLFNKGFDLLKAVKEQGSRETDGWKILEGDWLDIKIVHGLAPSRGLGDTIAKITHSIGIKKCGGCAKRQQKLNKTLPYYHEP